jgi:uncharacterized membrane protein
MAETSLPRGYGSYTAIDRHFSLPGIRKVDATRPLRWLRLGWRDWRRNPLSSAVYGVAFALVGSVLLHFARAWPYLFTAAVSGFMLVAPILAAGLYEISRRAEHGRRTRVAESLRGWTRNGDSMALAGLALMLVAIAWERLSAILFALFDGGELPAVDDFFATVFLSDGFVPFVVAYVLAGAVVAATVFVLTAIAIPMLTDRDVDTFTAMAASIKAVRTNPAAMATWAVLLAAMMAAGFATLLLGMIVLLPLAGYATWHAYRDLTRS